MSSEMDPSQRERLAAERFNRFCNRPDVMVVAAKYHNWPGAPTWELPTRMLAAFGLARLKALILQKDYEEALEELATDADIPLEDMRILAEGAYEATRCYHIASGLLPVGLGDWYSNEGHE